jgi:predicted cobalt transporter CbtA
MVAHLLLRGMLVGVIAGILAFGFARVFGESSVDRAIAFEEQMNHAAHTHEYAGAAHEHAGATHEHAGVAHEEEPELVSRATQAGLGLFTGVVVYGAAIGGLFALVFAFVYGRVGRLGPRGTAALLALAGFVAIVVVPGLKYPANPPAVGDPETIGMRTALFFTMLALSIAAMTVAVAAAQRLTVRFGQWNAALLAAAGFIVVVLVAHAAMPDINEVPQQFSATLLWQFRLAALGIQVVLWATLGLLFGALTERAMLAVAPRH